MRHYRIMAAAVAAICTLSGCGVQIGRNESMTAPEKTSVVTTTKKQTNDDSVQTMLTMRLSQGKAPELYRRLCR